ncbi:MAG: glycosyltransferase family 39 protein, partial [Desulfobulbaceae bacterium]|nr:glycosyltransferase family 39 protein [Desulfobulbaceae bacterium]
MSFFSVDAEVSAADWNRRAYLLLAALFLWRLFFIVFAPMDLAPDEAYYWDWSRYPALGYYSKPPFIAWINIASSALLPVSAFSVRLPAAIFASLSLLIFHALARRLFSPRTAFWALAATAASPGSCVIGYIMTIDAPLFFFWSLAVYCFWRALEDDAAGYRWWFAAAFAAGFGLLSKQMMLAYLVLVILFLATSRRDRHHL